MRKTRKVRAFCTLSCFFYEIKYKKLALFIFCGTMTINKIKKVEYYEDPPARYGDVGILMNIITKPLDTGYATGFDVSSALTTGFSDGNVYFKYNKGNHQYSFDYAINVRNYKDWIEDNQYTLAFDDQE